MNNIAIGIINYGNIRAEVSNSLMVAFMKDSEDKKILSGIIQTQGPYIDQNRNTVIDKFLSTSHSEWLLFLDTDVEITLDGIYKMIDIATKYNLYILGGIYFWGKEHHSTKIRPMIKQIINNHEEEMLDYPVDKEYFEVSSTGTGCLLIHRSVFEKVSNFGPDNNNYWFKTYDDNIANGAVGEDIYFCRLVKKHGFNIYVTPKVMLNHYKTVIFNYDLYKEQNNII